MQERTFFFSWAPTGTGKKQFLARGEKNVPMYFNLSLHEGSVIPTFFSVLLSSCPLMSAVLPRSTQSICCPSRQIRAGQQLFFYTYFAVNSKSSLTPRTNHRDRGNLYIFKPSNYRLKRVRSLDAVLIWSGRCEPWSNVGIYISLPCSINQYSVVQVKRSDVHTSLSQTTVKSQLNWLPGFSIRLFIFTKCTEVEICEHGNGMLIIW